MCHVLADESSLKLQFFLMELHGLNQHRYFYKIGFIVAVENRVWVNPQLDALRPNEDVIILR